jgi:hypothetical protein
MGRRQGHCGRSGNRWFVGRRNRSKAGALAGEPISSLRDRTGNQAFLDELQEPAAFATHKKYRLLMARLVKFAEQHGYVMIDRWEPLDVRQFRSRIEKDGESNGNGRLLKQCRGPWVRSVFF